MANSESGFVGRLLRGAYLTFHRRMQAHFSRFGVTADQFVLLEILAQEQGITQKQLSQRSYSDANTITAVLNRLEQKKMAQRRRCRQDGRAWRIFLTPKGRRLQSKLQRSAIRHHRLLEEIAPPKERERVRRWLNRAIEEMSPDSRPRPGKSRAGRRS